MAESAAARSEGSKSINPPILIIVIIFASVALTGKGEAVGITKGCSSEMLCQRSLCCGINRIHAAGTGSARLVFASIRDAHAPPTGSFTCLCHSGVCPKICSSWKERKMLTNTQHHHSLCPPKLILYPGCFSRSQQLQQVLKSCSCFLLSIYVFLSLAGSSYDSFAAGSRGSDKWVEVTGQVPRIVLISTERSRGLNSFFPAETTCNVSLRVQTSWPWLICPQLIKLVGIYTCGYCDSTSPYTYITVPGEASDGAALRIKSFSWRGEFIWAHLLSFVLELVFYTPSTGSGCYSWLWV